MALPDMMQYNWIPDTRVRRNSTSGSDNDSDDGPLLPAKHCRRYNPDGSRKRTSIGVVTRVCLFCSAMTMVCIILYIPLYDEASQMLPKKLVAGWSYNTNRDIKLYIHPTKITVLHSPKYICHKHEKRKLFLLIVVCSAPSHFDRRIVIRETWANYTLYLKTKAIADMVREKYKNYNLSNDLDPAIHALVKQYHIFEDETKNNESLPKVKRKVRDIKGFSDLLPQLAEALKHNITHLKLHETTKATTEEVRFDDDKIIPQFDMNDEFHKNNSDNDIETSNYFDYDYPSNVMKIPEKGEEDTMNLNDILLKLKYVNFFSENKPVSASNIDIDIEYKTVFLLGVPNDNDTNIQDDIVQEVEQYGDIIQEDFVDSYNNLTLKSIMMLKWVTNNCKDSLRYLLKTDDDVFLNMPKLIDLLKNKSAEYDKMAESGQKNKEYLLMGSLICGAKPVSDPGNKWFSPRYMYNRRRYPHYLSGTGYVMSIPTVEALYETALRTPLFHLEDIYITGICAASASPPIPHTAGPGFSYLPPSRTCPVQSRVTIHEVNATETRSMFAQMMNVTNADLCQRLHILQVRQDAIRKQQRLKSKKKQPHKPITYLNG